VTGSREGSSAGGRSGDGDGRGHLEANTAGGNGRLFGLEARLQRPDSESSEVGSSEILDLMEDFQSLDQWVH
jgi:hypothetical protein